jgi:hypothetical protein
MLEEFDDEPFLVNSTSELLESVESEDSTLTILPSSPLLVVDLSSDLAFLPMAALGTETGADFSLLLATISTVSGSLKAYGSSSSSIAGGVLTLKRPLDRLPPRDEGPEAEAAVLLPPRGVNGFCCFWGVGVERDDLVLASVLMILCSISLPLSSTKEAAGCLVGFRPLLGLLGVSSVTSVDVEPRLASSFSTSTSSVSPSSALIRALFRLPRRGCSSTDEEVFDGDAAVSAAKVAGGALAGVLLVFVRLELFLELGSESSSSSSLSSVASFLVEVRPSSLSGSFLAEVRLLCLLSAGEPVRDPFDVTEEGVPALEVSFGPLDGATVCLLFVAYEGVGSVF